MCMYKYMYAGTRIFDNVSLPKANNFLSHAYTFTRPPLADSASLPFRGLMLDAVLLSHVS